MAEIGSGGVAQAAFDTLADTVATFNAAVDGRINAILDKIATSAFVSTTPMAVADLITNFPPAIGNLGKYARVTDLYGSVDEIMRCRWDGVNYRWVPQREAFSGNSAVATGVVNIIPLITPPVLDLTATATGNITANVSTTNAYIGQSQIIRSRGALGLFSLSISGLIGGATLPLLQGGDRTLVYTAAGWKG